MRTVLRWIGAGAKSVAAGLFVIACATSVAALAQGPSTSPGGAFLPGLAYVVSGQWVFRNATAPLAIQPIGNINALVVTATPTANRTVTVPDATDTLVGQATTDTLSNKTLATPVVSGALDLGAAAGAANADRLKTYRIDSVTDATTTPVFTVTVPNGSHAAVIPITILTGLGAGGTIGDWECAGTGYGQIVVERFTGAATVATATALSNTGSACSAGATTIATAYAVSAMTGAVGVTQTFTVNVTVTKGAGSSANHHIFVQVDALNANASGITIS